MRPARREEYRAIASTVPEEEDFILWLAAIGIPPKLGPRLTSTRRMEMYWVEDRMHELGIIPAISEDRFHDYVTDYIDWLKENCNEIP